MKYTKPWTVDHLASEDSWHTWLAINALSGLEYQLLYFQDHIAVEFLDEQRAQEFAMEFGL